MSSVPTSVTYIYNSMNWSTSPARAATPSLSGCVRLTPCRTAVGHGGRHYQPASISSQRDTTDVVDHITTRIYCDCRHPSHGA